MLVYPRRMREGDKVFATMLGLFFMTFVQNEGFLEFLC